MTASAGEGTWTVRDANGEIHGPLALAELSQQTLKTMQNYGAQTTITTTQGARLVYEPYSIMADVDVYEWYYAPIIAERLAAATEED